MNYVNRCCMLNCNSIPTEINSSYSVINDCNEWASKPGFLFKITWKLSRKSCFLLVAISMLTWPLCNSYLNFSHEFTPISMFFTHVIPFRWKAVFLWEKLNFMHMIFTRCVISLFLKLNKNKIRRTVKSWQLSGGGGDYNFERVNSEQNDINIFLFYENIRSYGPSLLDKNKQTIISITPVIHFTIYQHQLTHCIELINIDYNKKSRSLHILFIIVV